VPLKDWPLKPSSLLNKEQGDVDGPLAELLARLPELEWQLSKQSLSFSPRALPPGLFRQTFDAPTTAYVSEIKADIVTLKTFHNNQKIAHYLALKINQKINVLVSVCSRYNRREPEMAVATYGVDKMSTRQQWLQSLEANINLLLEQKKALESVWAQKDKLRDSESQLRLARELGELEKRLTLARETFTRASG
jgi:hypothetical protein